MNVLNWTHKSILAFLVLVYFRTERTLISPYTLGVRSRFDSAKDGSESSTTGASKTSTASFTKLLEDDGNGNVGVAPYVDDNEGGKAANGTFQSIMTKCLRSSFSLSALTTSCVDSGIGGTISTHSELSGLCMSPSVDPRCNPPKAFPVSLLKTRCDMLLALFQNYGVDVLLSLGSPEIT